MLSSSPSDETCRERERGTRRVEKEKGRGAEIELEEPLKSSEEEIQLIYLCSGTDRSRSGKASDGFGLKRRNLKRWWWEVHKWSLSRLFGFAWNLLERKKRRKWTIKQTKSLSLFNFEKKNSRKMRVSSLRR